MKITSFELREKWFRFWESKGHTIISSAGILPDNDPTALFHNSGMHPLVPYLLGQKHSAGTRLANAQKCIRTGDIESVGDATHLTFFEMLGNWSLGDYFKQEQIAWSFEFLVDVLGIPLEKLAVSVFAGDEDSPRDEESARVWQEQGVIAERIAFLPKEHNWWKKGDVGPCGPDSEMFYWTGEDPAPLNFQETYEDPRWVEIWNDVFMQFRRDEFGVLHSLPAKNIDTGMGLERTVAILNGFRSVYQTDAFALIFQMISRIAGDDSFFQNPIADTDKARSARIVADHLRSSVVILTDKVSPSNLDQGYILRRLIRRAIRHGKKIGIDRPFCCEVAEAVIQSLQDAYPELSGNKMFVLKELEREESQFQKTLEKGEKEFERILEREQKISGKTAFYIYETYGFPFEMTEELAAEHGHVVSQKEFDQAMEEHQEKSRAGSQQKFAGGMGDKSDEMIVRLHTATHLLHTALRMVLGNHVEQRGSNITFERLRFDFSHEEKMTSEQIVRVEEIVNDAISRDLAVVRQEMTIAKAKEFGAIGLFEHKYGEKVSVYSVGDFSCEVCGGPHVERIGVLQYFKIQKEEAVSRGVRRIKAVISASV